ncbi:MAG: hypothetical protein JNK95_08730 [Candidatus Competibacter sp.]|nr:hypothetical protein [Candidatus Competibacter sp.]
MPMNRIQFQPGLSLPALLEQFGTETQCEAGIGMRSLVGRISPSPLWSGGSLSLAQWRA